MSAKTRIRKFLRQFSRVAVWGAGGAGQRVIKRYVDKGRLASVIDSNPNMLGKEISGVAVVAPGKDAFVDVDCVLVCSVAEDEIRESLKEYDLACPVYGVNDLLLLSVGGDSEMDYLGVDYELQCKDGLFELLARRPQFLVNVSYRITRYILKSSWPKVLFHLSSLIHLFFCVVFSISFPPTVQAGCGLKFPHFGTVVVHPKASFGHFAVIYHCSTIGSNDSGGVPIVGDRVTIFSGAIVVGETILGDGARVGANSFVSDLVCPPGSVVVGCPAKVI